MSSIYTVLRRTIIIFRQSRGREHKAVIRQIWENIMLIFRIQLEPHEYYLFHLNAKNIKPDHVITYLNSNQYSCEINPILNSPEWFYILDDKLNFDLYCRNLGIPVSHQYGFYSKNFRFLTDGGKLSSPKDLFYFLGKTGKPRFEAL